MAQAYLRHHEWARGIGIIREAAGFVRSASHITGEDILPVGWPDSGKPLTAREKFISFGRIRPRPGTPEAKVWAEWDTIQKNIWLWRESNNLLLDTRDEFPDRFTIVEFEKLVDKPDIFWLEVATALNITLPENFGLILESARRYQNKKKSGYQVPDASEWPEIHRAMLTQAKIKIKERWLNGKSSG